MLFEGLPIDVERHILSYDPTYLEKLRNEVFDELMEIAWKRITYKFFVGTIDFDFFIDDLQLVYEYVSDFEEEEQLEDEVLFL